MPINLHAQSIGAQEAFDRVSVLDQAPRIMKKVRGKLAPWLTDDAKKLMNERDKPLRKSRKSPHTEFYKMEYKKTRNAVNIAIRRAKASYYKDLLLNRRTKQILEDCKIDLSWKSKELKQKPSI